VNNAEAGTCCFCDARLSQNTGEKSAPPPARPQTPQTEGNLAIATDWRSEVASRLEAYRARRKRLSSNPAQPEFSFGDDENETPQPDNRSPETQASETASGVAASSAGVVVPPNNAVAPSPGVVAPSAKVPAPPAPTVRPRQNSSPWLDQLERSNRADQIERGNRADEIERGNRADQTDRASRADESDPVVIDVAQPPLNFGAGAYTNFLQRKTAERNAAQRDTESSLAESAVVPVASLAQRRRAGFLDTALLLFSYGAFLSLFAALGGRFAFSELDVAVVAATLSLFYALYVALFTFFGGSTPGMMLSHLRAVSFDGSDPTPGQLLWRSFGYLVSAGILMFGFLAALWDEDHLAWHDRISQTYLTAAEQASAAPAPPGQHTREDYRPR
jgi:uncharacterized RDD family membrane protein YckC